MSKKVLQKLIAVATAAVLAASVAPISASAAWQKDANANWSWTENGQKSTGWKKIQGTWYYFNGAGVMQTGWQYINGQWYYMSQSGAMQSGWKFVNGEWYFLKADGAMRTGWYKEGSSWYYLRSNGAMSRHWRKINNEWYHFAPGGKMSTGWIESNDMYYFADKDGKMVSGLAEIDGKVYYFDETDGQLMSGRIKIDNVTYTFGEDGAATGALKPKADVAYDTNGNKTTPTTSGTTYKPSYSGGGSSSSGGSSYVEVQSITLNKTNARMYVGDSMLLSASVYPTNATNRVVTWISSDESVATVSNGYVNALKKGTVTIKAIADTVEATCTIEVMEEEETGVKVTDITVTSPDDKKDIFVGEELQLTAAVNPADATNKEVTWYSTSDSVAPVDATGKVKGLKAGNATITATAKDGSGVSGSITIAVSDVPVTDSVAPVITTDLPTAKTATKGDKVTLTVAATASDEGTLSYQWYKGETAIDGATNATYVIESVEVSDAGSYKVVITNKKDDLTPATATSKVCELTVNDPDAPLVEITGFNAITTVTVTEDEHLTTAELAAAKLPGTVTLKYDGGTVDVNVTWTCASYDPDTIDTYTFTANYTLPFGYEDAVDPITVTAELGLDVEQTIPPVVHDNLLYGTPWSETNVAAADWAWQATQDSNNLTNGIIAADSDSYKSSTVFTTKPAVFTFTKNVTFKEIKIHVPVPSDLRTCTIGDLKIEVCIDGFWATIVNETGLKHPGSGKAYTYIASGDAVTADQIRFTISHNSAGSWGGISISEIELFANAKSTSYDKTFTKPDIPTEYAATPTFDTDLEATKTVDVGETVTLTVAASASDSGTLSYQWYKDGAAINNATSASYSYLASAEGSNSYKVVVTNSKEGFRPKSAESTTCVVTAATDQVNLALGKSYAYQNLDQMNWANPDDGKKLTDGVTPTDLRWNKGEYSIGQKQEETGDQQIIIVDLGKDLTFTQVAMDTLNGADGVQPLYVGSISYATEADADNWVAFGNFNNEKQDPMSIKTVAVFGEAAVTGRYVKISIGYGYNWRSLAEIRVWGAKGQEEPPAAPVVPTFDTDLTATKDATEGDEVTLTVVASKTDDGKLTYQWYKDDVAIEDATDASYTIAAAAVSDAGNYKVVVTNSRLGMTATATSTVCALAVSAAPAPASSNLIAGKAWTSTTVENESYGEGPFGANAKNWLTDGLKPTPETISSSTKDDCGVVLFYTPDASQPQSFVYDLEEGKNTFKQIQISVLNQMKGETQLGATPKNIKIEASIDGEWKTLFLNETDYSDLGENKVFVFSTDTAITASQLKFSFFTNNTGWPGVALNEIEVLADAATGSTDGALTVPDDAPTPPAPTSNNLIFGMTPTLGFNATYCEGENADNIGRLTDGVYSDAAENLFSFNYCDQTADAADFTYTFDSAKTFKQINMMFRAASPWGYENSGMSDHIKVAAEIDGEWKVIYDESGLLAGGAKDYILQSASDITATGLKFWFYAYSQNQSVSLAEIEVLAATSGTASATMAVPGGSDPEPETAAEPTFTTDLGTGSAIKAGADITLTVAATVTDEGVVTYQWYKGDEAIADATSASYTITGATAEDAGNYKVVATNTKGTATASKTSSVYTLAVSNNLIFGVPYSYEANKFHPTVPDNSFTKLTDGVSGLGYWGSSHVVGFWPNDGVAVLNFDFGEEISFKEISLGNLAGADGIMGLENIKIEVDTTGSADYTTILDAEFIPSHNANHRFVFNTDTAITAKGMKVTLKGYTNYHMYDELEVLAEKSTNTPDAPLTATKNVNLIKNKAYTYDSTEWYQEVTTDTDGVRLTDGVISTGYKASTTAMWWFKTDDKHVTLTFADLGETTFRQILISSVANNNDGVKLPASVKIEGKVSGEWKTLFDGSITDYTTVNGANTYVFNADADITATDLRITLVPDGGFLALGEIDVRATAFGGIAAQGTLTVPSSGGSDPEPPAVEAATPTFTADLEATKIATVGDVVTFLVSAATTDEGVLSYQWYKNDVAIPDATSANYTITTALTSDAGSYKVVVTNTLGEKTATATSTVCELSVVSSTPAAAAAPSITTDLPATKAVLKDSEVVLSVVAESTDGGDLSYQWYKDGSEIAGETGASYTFTASENAEYYVKVVNTVAEGNDASANSTTCAVTVSDNLLVGTPWNSTNVAAWAYGNLSTANTLTDGVAGDDSVSYTKNATFEDSPASFVYNKEVSFKEIHIHAMVPSDLTTLTPGSIKVEVMVDDSWTTILEKTSIANKAAGYTFKYTTAGGAVTTDQIRFTFTKAAGSAWSGISLSEIELFADIQTTTGADGQFTDPASITGTAETPVFSTALPATKTASIGDFVELSVAVNEVSDGGVVTYQWQKNGVDINDATGTTLNVSIAAPCSDTYSVQVKNTVEGKLPSTATSTCALSCTSDLVNLAQGKSYAYQETGLNWAGGNAEDGVKLTDGLVPNNTSWGDAGFAVGSNPSGTTQTIIVDLGRVLNFNIVSFETLRSSSGVNPVEDATVYYSTDKSTWTQLGDVIDNTQTDISIKTLAAKSETAVSGRYVKLAIENGNSWRALAEIRVWGADGQISADDPVNPTFDTNLPTSKVAAVGGEVTLTVAASVTDEGVVTYQWYKGDAAIEDATSATYTIASATTADAGSYKCVATNTLSDKTATAESVICNLTVSDNLLLGIPYGYEENKFHNYAPDNSHVLLTDGNETINNWDTAGSTVGFWPDSGTTLLTFEFGKNITFKELSLGNYAGSAGIGNLKNIKVQIQLENDSWITILNEANMTNYNAWHNYVFNSDTAYTAKAMKVTLVAHTGYHFYNELKLVAEKTTESPEAPLSGDASTSVNLLEGKVATYSITDKWYNANTTDATGTKLTDGNYSDSYNSTASAMWHTAQIEGAYPPVVVTFDSLSDIAFKQIVINSVTNSHDGISPIGHVQIERKVGETWSNLFDGDVTANAIDGANNLYFTSETEIHAEGLRFTFTNYGQFCVLGEIEAKNAIPTGVTITGALTVAE